MNNKYKFPIAAHSYFRAINKEQERALFLNSDTYQPKFTYGKDFDIEVIKGRQNKASGSVKVFEMLGFVGVAAELQRDADYFISYRKLNGSLFGEPKKELVLDILYNLSKRIKGSNAKYFSEIAHMASLGTVLRDNTRPTSDIFQKYKEYFQKYSSLSDNDNRDVLGLLGIHMEKSGLISEGWRLNVLKDNNSPARINQKAKKITIGDMYAPRTSRAASRIVAHEVYGHAVRGSRSTIDESEGFAILLEQLVGDSFSYRRSYRYLAVGIGWGVLGEPMDFRRVFEIVWRAMVIGSSYSVENARSHAFDECYRAFRGGRPEIPGAVFLKDGIYFDANIRMWDMLKNSKLSYNEFVDIIEGRRELLS